MHFVYVMTEEDRDLLEAYGYTLLKADEMRHVYCFDSNPSGDMNFCYETAELPACVGLHVFSDTMTF